MQPHILTLPEKLLIGRHLTMSLAADRTPELWRSFMPQRKSITNAVSNDLYSMQVYDAAYDFKTFNPAATFEKWAAVEVSDFKNVPDGMETLVLTSGLYAVFKHRGGPATGFKTFSYIFGEWLPASEYELDARPHFELLGEKYKGNEPDSEEEIWIPVKPRV
ncbi:MAG TPA: GyrI-like domain-containing protein [Patescibacteria group bacterium]|nr:GyrI-like domain-containing protein [Patescibacteria group bacterium]